MAAKTGAASLSAGLWRILITPIDTVKTTLQVGNSNYTLEIGKMIFETEKATNQNLQKNHVILLSKM